MSEQGESQMSGLHGAKAQWTLPAILALVLVVTILGSASLAQHKAFFSEPKPSRTLIQEAEGQPIAAWLTDQTSLDVAYNSNADEYLVVFGDELHSADFDIRARRVGCDGYPLGDAFGIGGGGMSLRGGPAVAYNASTNEYLVVWEEYWASDDHNIYGQRVAADGTLLGTRISIATDGGMESEPAVAAYHGTQSGYLVAWEGTVDRARGVAQSDAVILARRLSTSGALVGSVINVGDVGFPAIGGDPAVDCGDVCVVAWVKVMADPDLYARPVGLDGIKGTEIAVENFLYDQIHPAIAYNDVDDEFLVVWEAHHIDGDILGRRLAGDGTLAAPSFDISWQGSKLREHPDVVYSPTVEEYLVVWAYQEAAGNHDVYLQRVGSMEELIGAEDAVSSRSSHERLPAVATDEDRSFLVAWEDERNLGSQGVDVYGQLAAAPTFTGYVYEGKVDDQTFPLNGVTMGLYCAEEVTATGTLIVTATTDASGFYSLKAEQECGFYTVVEQDPPGYISNGATTEDGAIKTANAIQYESPLGCQVLDGDRFWDELDPQEAALRRLEADSLVPPYWRFESGIPRYVEVKVPVSSALPDDPVVQALDFLERYADLYRLDDPAAQFYLNRITSDENGGQHVFFGQHQNGNPVYGADLGVHLRDGYVTGTNGSYLPSIPAFGEPSLVAGQAETIALAAAPGTELEIIGDVRLAIFSQSLLDGDEADTYLAWRVMVRGYRTLDGTPTTWSYFVDAHSGTALVGLDDTRDHAWWDKQLEIRDGGGQKAKNCWYGWLFTGTPGSYQYVKTAPLWFTVWGPTLAYPGGDVDAEAAYTNTHAVWDYFYDKFGRASYNNQGASGLVEVYVHVDTSPSGGAAYHDPSCKTFEFSNGWTGLDVVAHEFTHGVTHSTSDLNYEHESGALNESYSDVFAVMVDDDDWMLYDGTGTTGRLGWRGPRKYSDYDECPLSEDHGCIHNNGNIPSEAAYLIAEGETFNGITVQGIGRSKTEQLYYQVLTKELSKNATFRDARDATVKIARDFRDLYPKPEGHGFTSDDVCSVVNAFAAVELGPADMDCDEIYDDSDDDSDGDGLANDEDNCAQVPNPDQSDIDKDGQGDYCDDDIDGDGWPNGYDLCPFHKNAKNVAGACIDQDGDGIWDADDNCPDRPNNDQGDMDGDGKGDVCDPDTDNDGVLNDGNNNGIRGDKPCAPGEVVGCDDNCWKHENSDQKDGDGDGVGDVCDLCLGAKDPENTDTDGDGLGDACDDDDDNDGVLDDDDNCPKHKNAAQTDLNANGLGTPCDSGEADSLLDIQGLIEFPSSVIVRLPLPLCLQCPEWLPESFWTQVRVDLPVDVSMRIVDDLGQVVSRTGPGDDMVLGFYPDADYYFQPPGGAGAVGSSLAAQSVYKGTHYYLELMPSEEVEPGRTYDIAIEVTSGSRPVAYQVYLPLMRR